MNKAEFQLRAIGDPRLAVHATSALPVWLWSVDGTQIFWANPVGAKLFGAHNATQLAERTFGPADAHRRQVAQLAGRLPPNEAVRLERLRGFGAPLGTLATCGCARLEFADGSHAILIAATTIAGRAMPLTERLQRLVEAVDQPIAAFARDGMFIGASDAGRPLLAFRNLSEIGLDQARNDALREGRVETQTGIGHMVLQRVGTGSDVGLVALIAPSAERQIPDYEQPATTPEAPAEFALVDEFAASPTEAAIETAASVTPAPDELPAHEPSPFVEAVADEPTPVTEPLATTPPSEAPAPEPRRNPLRFMWQMDADGCFLLGSDEFTHLIGIRTAAGFGRPWSEIADRFALDPEGRVLKAIATRNTFSGMTLNWPVDDDETLPVELAGLPVYDRMRNFAGYRGFGVCRDLDGLNRLAALRRFELPGDPPSQTPSLDTVPTNPVSYTHLTL